jgi:FixJ family two-component response regulator
LGSPFAPPGKTALSHIPVISIIDDDGSVRVATSNLVRSVGYTARAFASAEEFLLTNGVNGTSCIIADIQMGKMSGVELQAHLHAEGYRTPFIFITAFPAESIRETALSAGATCFLTKPFDANVLINCVDTALRIASGYT